MSVIAEAIENDKLPMTKEAVQVAWDPKNPYREIDEVNLKITPPETPVEIANTDDLTPA